MLIYSQSTGILWDDQGAILDRGYSGAGKGKNNPQMQDVRNVGPTPRGLWVIGAPYNSAKVGPAALPLIPSGHDALGRTAFVIHGDSTKHPGQASNGCMIFNRLTRDRIHRENDRILKVIA